jgi:hypothetical protein
MGWGRVRSTVTVWLLATVMRLYRSHKVEDPRPPSTQVGSQNNLHKWKSQNPSGKAKYLPFCDKPKSECKSKNQADKPKSECIKGNPGF